MQAVHPLKAFRERQEPQMSQKDLADLLGVDRITIHRWETDKRRPEGQHLTTIVERTGISARDLRPDLVEMLGAAE